MPATNPHQSATRAAITAEVDALLDRSCDGIVMDGPADRTVSVLTRETVYRGAVFTVEDMRLALPGADGKTTEVRRQVLRHAPCVVMLVHDEARDLYLLEREYRVGSDLFAYGLPAGLMDPGEQVEPAALRELEEETGVAPATPEDVTFDHVGAFYSSEGMSDELANIMVLHLRRWVSRPKHFDPDEHVESAWVTWEQLTGVPVTASNSVIAIQHETIRRLREGGNV
ncbi:NUDIX hydrolase [Bifidobacterium leontopitheci]|uniref:Hydrolase, NUDIX family n=1 Tax=Bifidobacterium leontopitheci TaxID=2650774 RepID=A0A6I1GH84_9BIFI|nr:NUDIX hydrolase [Bifidobacterium leontopitheci]KAB7790062.1 hydrolase, NUDIX family [Bifidobacterium leontopitheci]